MSAVAQYDFYDGLLTLVVVRRRNAPLILLGDPSLRRIEGCLNFYLFRKETLRR